MITTAAASPAGRTTPTSVPSSAPAAPAAPSADAKAQAETTASEQARRTGLPVPVPESTTETDTVTALPNGTLALKRTIEPTRTRKSGTWRDLDPTLIRAADGTVQPASTTSDLKLGGGGSTLLASMTNNGRKLTLSWPTMLPRPILSGNGALYPGVLPDIDLKVVAGEQGGFTHTLVVKTPQAAKNPQLATLKLGLTGDGVTVATNPDGSLTAKTADNKIAFTAPTPTMWDSRTTTEPTGTTLRTTPNSAGAESTAAIPATELASTERQPGVRAATAPVKTDVTAGTLALTPDAGLLLSPDTVFPLYIDPSWIPMRDNSSLYGWAQEAYPDTPGYGRTDYQPGAGYQHYRTKTGLERTYYRVDYNWQGRLDGKTINRVVFNTTQVYSAISSCENQYAEPVNLYLTNDTLTTNTTWNNRPTEAGLWGTASVPSSNTDSHCGNRLVDFDITANIAPHQNWEYLTLSVQGRETPRTTGNNGFKRFSRTAADTFIYIEYNTPPDAPTKLRMNPTPVNGGGTNGCGYIGAVNPAVGGVTLYATLTDPDGQDLDGHFVIRDTANDSVVHDSPWTPRGPNGHEAQTAIPVGTLAGGHTYRWSVQAGDGITASPWTDGCTFTVDDTPPTTPTVASTDYPVNGGGRTAGDKGTFTLTATDGQSGVDTIEYALNGPIPVGGATRATWDDIDKTWKIRDLPVGLWGTNHLFAQTVDKAGNRSQPTDYKFYAPSDPKATTTLGDITGDRRIDLVAIDDTGSLRMYTADTDPATGGVTASAPIHGPATAAGQATWTGTLITHRGGAGIFRDNLYAYAGGNLYMYRNSGADANGNYFATGSRRSTVPRPSTTRCVDPTNLPTRTCTGYAGDWTKVVAILAPGNVDADTDEAGNARLDLITLEQDSTGTRRLWLFHGTSGAASFDHATLIGTGTTWNNLDLLAPGDTTGDGLPDLWTRDRTTGQLHQYASRRNSDGTVDTTALGNTATRTIVGTGFDAAAYPKLNSDGDLNGDGKVDLWAQAADGRLYVALGTTPGPNGNAFGPMQLIADNQTPWTTCEKFPSAGDANVKIDLCGPILAKYKATGGPTGPLRLPTTGVRDDGKGGKYADFQGTAQGGTTNGNINWSPTTGAWYQHGGARTKWMQSGGLDGPLGYPVSDETTVLDGAGNGIGWVTHYAGNSGGPGAITWAEGGYLITGDIYNRWQATGGPRGVLGFPSSDAMPTTLKPGQYQNFRAPGAQTDTGSIYWSAATGAWPVHGANRAAWVAQGYEGGPLGFPTSGEYTVAGGVRGDYQGGYIRWNALTGISTVHNPGDSTATQRTEYAGDFNGDKRADVLTVYDYGQASTAFYVSSAGSDGTIGAPRQAWVSHLGWFDAAHAKFAVGDYNGDGRDDVAAFYGYPDGSTRLITFLARPDGAFDEGVQSAYTAPGTRDWAKAVLLGGDFNGDHRADLAMMYDHGNETTGAYTWLSKPDGTFDDATASWQSGAWNWGQARGKYVTGDFDGDGRDDIAAMYGYGDPNGGAVALFTLKSRPDGGFDGTVKSWNVPAGNWEWNRVQLVAGDFDGDHRTDIGAMYEYAGRDTALFTFHARPDGTFDNDVNKWRSGPGQWSNAEAKAVTGDFDNDGHHDIAAMYENPDGSTTIRTLHTNTDGTVNAPVDGWKASPGTW
ncbi:FG-GAP-like repeat-containing protein [Embleya sp. NPDC020630]|uniref:FG-GAP-like repeat-containing protein n=1 Tax=Embleya sp. NPDC020630 TaxID=3363979 RepID=UPI003791BFA9